MAVRLSRLIAVVSKPPFNPCRIHDGVVLCNAAAFLSVVLGCSLTESTKRRDETETESEGTGSASTSTTSTDIGTVHPESQLQINNFLTVNDHKIKRKEENATFFNDENNITTLPFKNNNNFMDENGGFLGSSSQRRLILNQLKQIQYSPLSSSPSSILSSSSDVKWSPMIDQVTPKTLQNPHLSFKPDFLSLRSKLNTGNDANAKTDSDLNSQIGSSLEERQDEQSPIINPIVKLPNQFRSLIVAPEMLV